MNCNGTSVTVNELWDTRSIRKMDKTINTQLWRIKDLQNLQTHDRKLLYHFDCETSLFTGESPV